MKVILSVILFLITTSGFVNAQNKNRKFVSAEMSVHGDVTVIVSDGVYTINSYSPQIIETTFVPSGQEFNSESHAVVMQPIFSSPEFIDENNQVFFKTSGITVNIQKSPFQISYSYKDKPVISEK